MLDLFGPTAGFFARIRLAMLVAIFLAAGVIVNLKTYAGISLNETAIALIVCGCFLFSVIIAIIWHRRTAYQDN